MTSIQVTELSDEEVYPTSRLGSETIPEVITEIFLDKLLEATAHCGRKFRLEWKGTNRVPQTNVGGYQIGWTQHGVVQDANGKMIGTYERVKDLDGPNHDENEMLIVLDH